MRTEFIDRGLIFSPASLPGEEFVTEYLGVKHETWRVSLENRPDFVTGFYRIKKGKHLTRKSLSENFDDLREKYNL